MIAFLENNLVPMYLCFMFAVCAAGVWGICRLDRRARIARGDR